MEIKVEKKLKFNPLSFFCNVYTYLCTNYIDKKNKKVTKSESDGKFGSLQNAYKTFIEILFCLRDIWNKPKGFFFFHNQLNVSCSKNPF